MLYATTRVVATCYHRVVYMNLMNMCVCVNEREEERMFFSTSHVCIGVFVYVVCVFFYHLGLSLYVCV